VGEAEDLILLHTRLGYDRQRRIVADWPDQDLNAALASARRRFQLEDPE